MAYSRPLCVHLRGAMAQWGLRGGGECGSMWSNGEICPCGHSTPVVIGTQCQCWALGFFSLERILCACHEPANKQACVEERIERDDMCWWPTFHFDMYSCEDEPMEIHESNSIPYEERKRLN